MQKGMCTYSGKDALTALQKAEFCKRKIYGKSLCFYVVKTHRTPQARIEGACTVVAEYEVFTGTERTRFKAAAHADRTVPIGGHGNDVYVIRFFGAFEFGEKMAVPRRPHKNDVPLHIEGVAGQSDDAADFGLFACRFASKKRILLRGKKSRHRVGGRRENGRRRRGAGFEHHDVAAQKRVHDRRKYGTRIGRDIGLHGNRAGADGKYRKGAHERNARKDDQQKKNYRNNRTLALFFYVERIVVQFLFHACNIP